MKSNRFLALTLALVAVAVVAGVLIVGGPIQGRQDKFDGQRLAELTDLARALLCEANPRTTSPALPQELTVETMRAHCSNAGIGADDLTDNETGQPYGYERTSDRDFTICATFHDAARTDTLYPGRRHGALDTETGCISGRIR